MKDDGMLPPADLGDYLPLVRNLAKSAYVKLNRAIAFEDLVADGSLGLVKARHRWQGLGPFRPWAMKWIKGEMYDGARRWNMVTYWGQQVRKDRVSLVSLDAPLVDDPTQTHGDLLPAPPSDPDRAILFREVMSIVGRMRPIDQDRVALELMDFGKAEIREQHNGARENSRRMRAKCRTIARIRTEIGARA